MFKKFINELIAAQTAEEINHIFYRWEKEKNNFGIDQAYQNEVIKWKELETLTALVNKLNKLMDA